MNPVAERTCFSQVASRDGQGQPGQGPPGLGLVSAAILAGWWAPAAGDAPLPRGLAALSVGLGADPARGVAVVRCL